MAVALEMLSFIVPTKLIAQKYPNGWDQCLLDHKPLIGGRVWFDEHLFRDGAMNSIDISMLVKKWRSLGFKPFKRRSGDRYWNEMCVVESFADAPTLPCDWIEIEHDIGAAFLKGTIPGRVAGR